MGPLRCAIDKYFNVSAVVEGTGKTRRTATGKPTQVCIALHESSTSSESAPVLTKNVPWPTGEEPPSELSYDATAEVLILKSTTTLARIPFRSRALRGIAERQSAKAAASASSSSAAVGPRVLATFGSTTTGEKEKAGKGKKAQSASTDSSTGNASAAMVEAIRESLTEEPPADSHWKKMKKRVKSTPPAASSLAHLLTHGEQASLLAVLKARQEAGDDGVADVLSALLEAEAFGYRIVDDVFSLSESLGTSSALIERLIGGGTERKGEEEKSGVVGEKTFVRMLKAAAGKPVKEGRPILLRILGVPFEDKATAAAASAVLTSEEAATLVDWLADIYEDEKEAKEHGKVLSLLSLLLDSHSMQFMADRATHDRLLRAASLIGGMAALTGIFTELEHVSRARAARPKRAGEDGDEGGYVVKKITLTVRTWSPEIQAQENEKKKKG